jgi:hypothetical protein
MSNFFSICIKSLKKCKYELRNKEHFADFKMFEMYFFNSPKTVSLNFVCECFGWIIFYIFYYSIQLFVLI